MRQTLEITVKVPCPYNCTFCPQTALSKAYKSDKHLLDIRDLRKILDKVPRETDIVFAGFSEPFLHPQVHGMMAMVRHFQFKELQVYSTLLGLRGEQLETLKLVRPDYFRVHIPDTKAFIVPSATWIKAHETFLLAGVPATYMTMGEVPDEIKLHLAVHGIVVETPDMLSRGGTLWISNDIKGPIRCGMERWHSNVLLPNGDVVGDCHDFILSVHLGNLLIHPYEHIYSEAESWKKNMERDATGTICARCGWSVPA